MTRGNPGNTQPEGQRMSGKSPDTLRAPSLDMRIRILSVTASGRYVLEDIERVEGPVCESRTCGYQPRPFCAGQTRLVAACTYIPSDRHGDGRQAASRMNRQHRVLEHLSATLRGAAESGQR